MDRDKREGLKKRKIWKFPSLADWGQKMAEFNFFQLNAHIVVKMVKFVFYPQHSYQGWPEVGSDLRWKIPLFF